MVRTNNLLLSTLALSTCCVAPTIGFAPEAPTSRLSHVRLDLAESSPSAAIGNNGPLSSIDVVDDDQISSIGGGSDLPPVLQQITDERRNFQMNLGKAMDTLRKDMPYILKKTPDYSIYHDDITVVDPSGVQLTGMDNYKSSIKFFQQFVSFWFQPEQNGIQYRLVYDFARSSIRISWHAVLVPKMPLGKPLHVDGISMYRLETDTGKIIEHKLENLSINNTPIVPPYGVFSLMQQEWGLAGAGVPGGQIPMGV
uniref:SnoaL-like domain-containing protein n=1 Tax=Pseudo-nitzschia australis TaxID=44445 RepID=A0A7S4EHH6_9STRA|mmetsp:Transcript_3371/g.7242  ORF Transcript_3371/g.7242 Transcript_3371/m.7242 type:complete len:254 (-) Transcript_3371:289-1050(-)|eukprot:CAMPEP_0168178822 /NCGR_PEP_ID=MMETSP0139_2-20121125/9412_1 /TAXON_ID=44445 /ORGANISM="Pseudo-nitzschia australis, Strain 10249 10 AB" /LENGTH=253 /DNA_ID=CAMNT_0008098405 /DNA_START=203 /DNA_END=964 /DNA_ORIENTATION=+